MQKFVLILFSAWLLSGCSHLLFQPMRKAVMEPSQIGIDYKTFRIPTSDSLSLNSWLLKPKHDHLGNVIFFHGNAENISTHIASVYWLVEYGYQVLLVDYRGFGASGGVASLEGAIDDISNATDWFLKHEERHGKPTFILGQSLGAAMSIYAMSRDKALVAQLDGLVFEASFASYRKIAQETLASHWLSWLFQYPLSWTITDNYAPQKHIQKLDEWPVLLVHSREDKIVGYHHAELLLEQAGENIEHLPTKGRHIQSFQFPIYRDDLLQFFANNSKH